MNEQYFRTLSFCPNVDSIAAAAAFVEEVMKQIGLSPKQMYKINIAVDEIYSNIVQYSKASKAEIQCGMENGAAVVILRDNGIPFDPTQQVAPNIALSAENRPIGGLGIFMTKKLMREMRYCYVNGQNEITLVLNKQET